VLFKCKNLGDEQKPQGYIFLEIIVPFGHFKEKLGPDVIFASFKTFFATKKICFTAARID
jgi:hypothetical protein